MIINYCEIKELLKNCFIDDGTRISTKHSAFNGEREFALVLLEQCIGLLSRHNINDKFILEYLRGLLLMTNPGNHHYEKFIGAFVQNSKERKKSLSGDKLRKNDIAVIKELMQDNMAEYTMKGEYESCCYSAMLAYFKTAYCILAKKLDENINHIGIVADIDDELDSIQIFTCEIPKDFIIVDWHSTNLINSIYMLYKNKYSGLDKSSILDLVAADVIEKEYYYKDERFSIAPSILVKQYCAIIEHEVNEIIQLLNFPDKPQKHLMWSKMKKYVGKHNIDLSATDYTLSEVLEELYKIRNNVMHGHDITKEEYNCISHYKNLGLFRGISIEKLKLKTGKIHPTIEELKEYIYSN